MLPALTKRQKAIYDFLLSTIREKGFAPSIPEIGAKFKIASTNGVSDHLKALEKKGYIRRVGKRAIEVLSALGAPVLTAVRDIPILGRVPAGKPFLSEENSEGLLTIPSDMGSGKLFALQVKGDSMIGAGIMEGDRVIVKQQGTAENGAIVCALIEGEATLKRFYEKDGVVTLKAENEKYKPITVASGEFRIVGRVVGLMRKF
ncbi:MAG: transcriptional repressor LexA [Deltaproteobacteria bacterium]|nr:transcriptional repressor LexA [Deltaproteobacteria bacterium]MBI3065902.1 transcriptional repressor LexA [Deltaproteobacteria bacterium]